jgi:hypothetical protein
LSLSAREAEAWAEGCSVGQGYWDQFIADWVRRTSHARHLGAMTGSVGPRQQPGDSEGEPLMTERDDI